MAVIGSGRVLRQLTFGHSSPRSARDGLDAGLARQAQRGSWNRRLVARLQAYGSGARDDFSDVPVEPGPLTEFQCRVLCRCRRIPPGKTLTYGQLAAEVGQAGAARAVGNCLAANRVPLVIPCHRVVAAGGRLGGYSAPGGTRLKQRLLDLEAGRTVP